MGFQKNDAHEIAQGHGEVGLCVVGMYPRAGPEVDQCVVDSNQGCGQESGQCTVDSW